MLRPSGNWNELVFLVAFLSGDILLIASFIVARLNWRLDLPPYNLRTRSLDVLLHPSKYVRPKALGITRLLQLLGALLLFAALLALGHQAIHDFLHSAVPFESVQSAPEEQEAIAAERNLFAALKKKDQTELSNLLAEEFQFRNGSEKPIGKTEFLKAATSFDGIILDITSNDLHAQIIGDVAVVTGTQNSVVRLPDGNRATSSVLFTDVFTRRKNRWLLVLAHGVETHPEHGVGP